MASKPVEISGQRFKTDDDDGGQELRWPTVVEESALPAGASTSALQTSTSAAIIAAIVAVGVIVSSVLAAVYNSDGLAIAQGSVSGTSYIHKFGNAPDFDTADGTVSIWDGAQDNVAWEAMDYTYSATADIDNCSSDSASDTVDVEIQGLDTNYALSTQTITMTGLTKSPLDPDLIRIFRVKNVGAADLVGHVFCFVDGADTTPADGVPDDPTLIRAIIQPGNNQTLMAIYTVPAGKTAYMRGFYASSSGASRSSNYAISLLARPFGQVFQLKHINAVSDSASSYLLHSYNEPEKFLEKTDIEMRTSMKVAAGTAGSISAGFDIVLVDN